MRTAGQKLYLKVGGRDYDESLKWYPTLYSIVMAVQDLRESSLDRTQESAYALRCPNGCMRVIKKRSSAFAHQGRHACPDCGSALGCSEADDEDFAKADRVSDKVRR